MNRLWINLLAPVVSLALVGGLYGQIRTYARVDDTTPFHAAVRTAMEAFPVRIGVWEGVDASLPPAAQALLRPNVLFARRFTNPETNRRANLIVVHCRDARDMSGHYPPNCYPGNGWTLQGPPRITVRAIWDRAIPVAQYSFARRELQGDVTAAIYNFFILPSGKFVTDMSEVREASGDYRLRPYGAAQFQVVFDGTVPEAERESIVDELLKPLGPVVDVLTLKGSHEVKP